MTVLDASFNQIRNVADGCGDMVNLNDLKINDNLLDFLPSSIGKLTNLKTLDVSSNRLLSLPMEIVNLTNVEELRVHENKFEMMMQGNPDLGTIATIKYFQACAACSFSRRLKLNVLGLQSVPIDVFKYTTLTYLSFTGNKLENIDDNIGQLPHLKSLSLRSNKLSVLPDSCAGLT